jgi:hypothetical protein
MDKFKELAKRALHLKINEGRINYDSGHSERIHPNLSIQLRKRNHSLGNHPIFPASDETHFEEKMISRRFLDVLKNYKRVHELDNIDMDELRDNTVNLIYDCIKNEVKNKKKLEDLAINLVRHEFDMSEDDVEIVAELTTDIDIEGIKKNPSPVTIEEMDFDNHASIENANDEVYKRRFINTMIQGASMKTNHMFHLIQDELMNINHKLPQLYSKLMTAADYAYLVVDDSEPKHAGGIIKVEFPKNENDKPKLHAQAMTLPVLIHELVKGAMELLASHGLPKDLKLSEYVLGKADFIAAETWDIRLGPPIWEQFTEMIEPADFHLKHHIFQEIVSLPVKEFNLSMREIMAGTKEGKKIIMNLSDRIKKDIINDDLNFSLNEYSDEDSLNIDDIDTLDWE